MVLSPLIFVVHNCILLIKFIKSIRAVHGSVMVGFVPNSELT